VRSKPPRAELATWGKEHRASGSGGNLIYLILQALDDVLEGD